MSLLPSRLLMTLGQRGVNAVAMRQRPLLDATFNQSMAAPLPASLPIDIGGPLSLADTLNEWSQVAGVLHNSNTAGAFDKDIWLNAGFARVCGRTQYIRFLVVNNTGAYPFAGWSTLTGAQQLSTSSGNPAMYFSTGTGVRGVAGADLGDMGLVVAQGDTWEFWFILRTQGGYILFRRNGGPITLLWVSASGANTPMYPHYRVVNKLIDLDAFSVLDLGATDPRFATDYGLATSRLVSPAAGVTTTNTPDAVIEWNGIYSAVSASQILPRYVDMSNRWSLVIQATALIQLADVNAGATTLRFSVASGLTDGQAFRLMLIMEGNVYRIYLNNALMGSYTDPTSFQTTVTTIRNNGTTTTELVCWPRTITLPPQIALPLPPADLLRASFSTDMAAPLPASLPVDVGGPLTVVDTGNKESISGGKLNMLPATGWGVEGIYDAASRARVAGRALLVDFSMSTVGQFVPAFWSSQPRLYTSVITDFVHAVYVPSGGGNLNLNDAGIGYTSPLLSVGLVGGTAYQMLTVLRGAGAFYFIRGGIYTTWTLVWVSSIATTSPLYAVSETFSASGAVDNLRVLDLALYDARFASDYALATFHDPAPASSMVLLEAHTPDCVLDWQFTFDSSSTNSYGYRLLDNLTDKYTLRINAAGTMNLRSVVGGTTTTLLTVATPTAGNTVFQNGVSYRLMGVIVGNVHTWYVDNIQKINYTDPANSFPTATGVNTPVGSILTRITNWPRTITLPAGI